MKPGLRLTLIALFAILSIWMAMEMSRLPLWGHRPFGFLLGLWMALFLLFGKRLFRDAERTRWLALSTLSGLLLGIGFPPYPTAFLYFVAFIPLLIAVGEIIRKYPQQALRRSFWYIYHAFVLWNIIATYWVVNTALAGGLFAIFVNPFFMSLPWLLWILVRRRNSAPWVLWLLPVAWICFEFGHMRWEISWPWLTLGNAWAAMPAWIQWYEYTGVYGGSLWIWALNILLLPLFQDRSGLKSVRQWALPMLLILLPVGFSLWIYANTSDVGRPANFTVIQPNYEPHYQKFQVPQFEQIKQFIRLSEEGLSDSTDFLVLPETSFDRIRLDEFDLNEPISVYRRLLQNFPATAVVSGVDAVMVYDSLPRGLSNVRPMIQGPDTIYWTAANAAVCFDTGTTFQLYNKSKFVPGAEIFPYKDLLVFLGPLVKKLGGSTYGLLSQDYRLAFEHAGFRVAPVICYESVYGEYVNGYIKAGAQAICIMTNDGWWDDTPGHIQHLQIGRLRAIETRKSIARAANTGTSCFINQRGDIQQPTAYEVEAALSQTLLLNDIRTFYVRFGDWIGYGCLILLLLFPLAYLRGKSQPSA